MRSRTGSRWSDRGRAPGGPRRQRGVALIIALILVALATVLATKLTFDGWMERRRTMSVLAAEQALHFALGAEALAADVLSQSQNSQEVTLADAWAQPTQPLPLTPDNDAEGEPIGTLQGALEDMQGRFNLNNLASVTQDGKQDPFPLQQFQQLLTLLKIDPKFAGLARDWIDPDDLPGSPDGAEDAVYTAQNPPYRTGNYPMTSTSELMNLPGFTADLYRKLAPYVTALPTAQSAINICTAPALVLQSLDRNLASDFNPEVLAASRKNGCFPDTKTLQNMLAGDYSKISPYTTTTSNYFRLTTRITLGTTEFTLYSLLLRTNNKVTPLLRSFGTT